MFLFFLVDLVFPEYLIEAGAAVLGAFKVHVKTDQGRQFFCDGITEPAKMTKF